MLCSLISITFDSPQLGKQLKQNIYNLRTLIQDMLNFDFLEKGLGIVLLPHFVYDFSKKCFSSYTPLNLEILVNMCIAFVC